MSRQWGGQSPLALSLLLGLPSGLEGVFPVYFPGQSREKCSWPVASGTGRAQGTDKGQATARPPMPAEPRAPHLLEAGELSSSQSSSPLKYSGSPKQRASLK